MATSLRFSAIYAFGDSLSDAGNDSIATIGFLPVSPPYYRSGYGFLDASATVFSNGPVWVQDLSRELGLGTLGPSLYTGDDYAYGGAEANPTASGFPGIGASVISLDSQLTQFGGSAPSDALYTLSIGTNDVQTILEKPEFDLFKQVQQIETSVSNEMSFVSSLIDRGARSFLVVDVPDMTYLPTVTKHDTPSQVALAGRLSNLYNVDLNAGLESLAQARGATVTILPLYSLSDQAVTQPAQFGLTNVTDPAWTGNLTDSGSGAVVTPDPNSFLFWDEYHPTAHVQQLIADDANALLTTGAPLYPAPPVQLTDASTGISSTQYATVPTGTDTALQSQFLYPGLNSVAMSATTPSIFLKGGDGADALQVTSGNNVLDGGGGSNFLVGGTGDDVFFDDGRQGAVTWSTIVNFHLGDMATIFGFHSGLSTLAFGAAEGASGFQGLTMHSELNGAGTGVNASLTFAGIDPAMVAAHFSITDGTLNAGSSDPVDYLLVQYNK